MCFVLLGDLGVLGGSLIVSTAHGRDARGTGKLWWRALVPRASRPCRVQCELECTQQQPTTTITTTTRLRIFASSRFKTNRPTLPHPAWRSPRSLRLRGKKILRTLTDAGRPS